MQAIAGATTGTTDIRRIISGMQSSFAATKAKLEASRRAREKARARADAERRHLNRLEKKRLQKNLAAATTGLMRIIEFAKSSEIQEFIKLEGEIHAMGNNRARIFSQHEDGAGELMFYYAQFAPKGDDDLRDQRAGIFLKPHDVLFVTSDYNSHGWAMKDFCTKPAEVHKFLQDPDIELCLGTLISADTLAQSAGLNPLQLQRRNETVVLDYANLFGLVLIECADEKKFKRYCEAALARLARN